MEITAHIEQVNMKLQLLLKQHDHLLKENTRLRQTIASLHEEQQLAMEKLEECHQQNLILKSSVATMDPNDKKELEQRITQYVKNIDQCISLLSR